jgi:anaerobic selenocysteine-containing dehydrogenase
MRLTACCTRCNVPVSVAKDVGSASAGTTHSPPSPIPCSMRFRFLEAGEALPTHKENPKMGGDHPFVLTSGHNRWSIHSMNTTNPLLLRTHRGQPHAVINTDDARAHGINDGDEVRVWNDIG